MPSSALPSSMALFPLAPFSAVITSGRTEAEDLTIASGFAVRKNPHPSGGEYLQATAPSSVGGGVFEGEPGTYDLTLGYFDESDGVSHLEILINGTVAASFDWDSLDGDDTVTKASKAEFTLLGIALDTGDTIELRGTMDGGEPLRIDYLDLEAGEGAPAIESFIVEAENFNIGQGFEVVRNGAASGGLNLQHTHGTLASASYTVEKAGTFNVTVGYFDETDGASEMRVLLNGVQIADWTWDSVAGASIASVASKAEKVLGNLALGEGDVITLEGSGDSGEPLRLDFLKFDAVDGVDPEPTPSLDFWFLRDGQVVLALNDGDGNFTERNTGIEEGNSRVHAGDFDGDGDVDFFTWKVLANPFPLPEWNALPDDYTFELQTIVYENDGSGNFTSAMLDNQTLPYEFDAYHVASIPSPGPDYRTQILRHFLDIQDAADYDGDGDVDLVGVAFSAGGIFVLENNGDGTFEMTTPEFPGISDDWIYYTSPQAYDLDVSTVLHFGDFNGDDDLDILYGRSNAYPNSYILINDGEGGFEQIAAFTPQEGNILEKIVDIDADGDMDVFSNTQGEGGGIGLFMNDGTGAYSLDYESGSEAFHASWPPFELYGVGPSAVGNFDDDPWAEIINASMVNTGEGMEPGLRVIDIYEDADRIQFNVTSLDPTITGQVVGQGDFDGDGDLDVILSQQNEDTIYPDDKSTLYLLRNDGLANFTVVGSIAEMADNWSEYEQYDTRDIGDRFASIRTAYLDDAGPMV